MGIGLFYTAIKFPFLVVIKSVDVAAYGKGGCLAAKCSVYVCFLKYFRPIIF